MPITGSKLVKFCFYWLFMLASGQAALTESQNATRYTNVTLKPTNFVPHHFTSHNNITILHEVHEPPKPIAPPKPEQEHLKIQLSKPDHDHFRVKPIELNTHEVLPLPLKPVKKKPYTLLDKAVPPITAYEKPRPLKEYELHPVTFDFNLGDLEDLEHTSLQKEDLSEEELHLLRSSGEKSNTDALTYTLEDEGSVSTSVELEGDGNSNSSKSSTIPPLSVTLHDLDLPTVVSVSPHIFKIIKNKSTKKGRELMKDAEMQKTFGTNYNSISRYFGTEDSAGEETNATSDSLHTANLFQILTNLYDHFYWQAADIQTKVTTGCGLEMQAYLTGLHGNYDWAQRAYDASGRYRGQIFYGNDKWLGQKIFCYELNRQLRPEERKHFEFEFFSALVALRIWAPQKLDIKLQVGECLPKSCTSQDVHAMLMLDPHSHMLTSLQGPLANSTNSTLVHVLRVRTVPGIYSYWRELKFQIFLSFMLTLVLIVLAATWYQSRLTQRQLVANTVPSISGAKIDDNITVPPSLMGKAFELYQMRTLDNNNVVDIESDVKSNTRRPQTLPKQRENGSGYAESSCDTNTSAATTAASNLGNETQTTDAATDYKVETGSSLGAGGTYEAKQQLGLHEQFLLCFAFQTNASAILNIDEHKESQTSCVHGLRVLSVLWTIMVHTYLEMFTIAENRFQRIIVERSVWYQFVGNATFSVDTFFFIGGFLVTLLFLKQEKKYPDDTRQYIRRSFVDTVVIVVYRYARLTPAYLFVILFNDFSLRQTFDASVFQPAVTPNTCSQYWWRNILYINNFYPLSEICMIWSWYMANDMQFFIMASVLLVISTRYFKTALLTLASFLLSSWAVAGVISLHHHYTHKVSNPFESFDFLYDKPWQRVGTYIMGMMAGYIISKVKTAPRVPYRLNFVLLLSSFSLLALIIFGVWQGELDEVSTAFYVSIGHTAFGLGLVWIVLSCCWNLSPTLNRILSYRCLWPLSRLTYCTYLIHPLIMLIVSFRMSGPAHLNNLFVITIFLGNAVLSFGVAFFISVLFEAPVIRMLKITFKKSH